MTILVSVETVLLVLMLILVAGLLRSHAEILRRLGSGESSSPDPPGPEVTPRRDATASAFDVSGVTLARESIGVAVSGVSHDTLLAFLSSGCLTCKGFWDSLGSGRTDVPGGARLVVVTKDPSHESLSKLRALASDHLTVVMSSEAWEEYQVPMSPYFVYVSGPQGAIAGEGTAQTWDQVLSLVRDALLDAGEGPRGGGRAPERFDRADTELAAAGITPDHRSLYEPDDPAIVEGPGFRD